MKIGITGVIDNNDLSIKNGIEPYLFERLINDGKPVFQRKQVAGIERHIPAMYLGYCPIPIPFDLIYPFLVIERFLDEGREHGFYAVRHVGDRGIGKVFFFR